jgi:hypothetical protein
MTQENPKQTDQLFQLYSPIQQKALTLLEEHPEVEKILTGRWKKRELGEFCFYKPSDPDKEKIIWNPYLMAYFQKLNIPLESDLDMVLRIVNLPARAGYYSATNQFGRKTTLAYGYHDRFRISLAIPKDRNTIVYYSILFSGSLPEKDIYLSENSSPMEPFLSLDHSWAKTFQHALNNPHPLVRRK